MTAAGFLACGSSVSLQDWLNSDAASLDLDSFVEGLATQDSIGAMFKNFKDHKVKLEAIRFVIYSSDGSELASAEVTPDDFK